MIVPTVPEVGISFKSACYQSSFSTDEELVHSQGCYFAYKGNMLYYERNSTNSPEWVDIEFSDEVLAELDIGVASYNGGRFLFINTYTDVGRMTSCPIQFRNTGIPQLGTLECPSTLFTGYTQPGTSEEFRTVVRAKRVVMWTGSSGTYELYLHVKLLGVYDGLSISPRESEILDLPTMHYYSRPEALDATLWVNTGFTNDTPTATPAGEQSGVTEAVLSRGVNSPWVSSGSATGYMFFSLNDAGLSWIATGSRGNTAYKLEWDKPREFKVFASFAKWTSSPGYRGDAHLLSPIACNNGLRRARLTFLSGTMNHGEGGEMTAVGKCIELMNILSYTGYMGVTALLYFF
jgi:hypothetical protein